MKDIYDKYLKLPKASTNVHEKYLKFPKTNMVDKLMKASGRNPEYDEVRGLRYNSDKLRYDLIPPLANREYAKIWTQALGKYPEGNWEKGMPWTEVIASAMRH